MSTVRRVTGRIDELGENGFENKQAVVLAMAIDETVEDRLEGVIAPLLVRFDGIDSKFEGMNSKIEGMNLKIEGIHDRLGSRKYEIGVLTATFGLALIGIAIAVYEYVVKPMFG